MYIYFVSIYYLDTIKDLYMQFTNYNIPVKYYPYIIKPYSKFDVSLNKYIFCYKDYLDKEITIYKNLICYIEDGATVTTLVYSKEDIRNELVVAITEEEAFNTLNRITRHINKPEYLYAEIYNSYLKLINVIHSTNQHTKKLHTKLHNLVQRIAKLENNGYYQNIGYLLEKTKRYYDYTVIASRLKDYPLLTVSSIYTYDEFMGIFIPELYKYSIIKETSLCPNV